MRLLTRPSTHPLTQPPPTPPSTPVLLAQPKVVDSPQVTFSTTMGKGKGFLPAFPSFNADVQHSQKVGGGAGPVVLAGCLAGCTPLGAVALVMQAVARSKSPPSVTDTRR